jgi:hypothetical protein
MFSDSNAEVGPSLLKPQAMLRDVHQMAGDATSVRNPVYRGLHIFFFDDFLR